MRDELEVLFGGAAGGGKTAGTAMAALQYVGEPNYRALILRRQLTDAKLSGGISEVLDDWLTNTDAKKVGDAWYFPSGAIVQLGYLKSPQDMYRYDSSRFDAEFFEELTHFLELQYRYMIARVRRARNSNIPPRVWSTTNPGGKGHHWVKAKFIDHNHDPTCKFVPARLKDNPYIDQKTYISSLNKLDPITRAQKLDGNWIVSLADSLFKREKVQIIPQLPQGLKFVRYWDKASTVPKKNNQDPDYTVGVKLAEQQGIYFFVDVVRVRRTSADVQALIAQVAQLDGVATKIYMEQEPGSSGVDVINYYAREVLKGYSFYGVKTTGSKTDRAAPLSAAWDNGNVRLLLASWNTEFLDELELFPQGAHDDQVDAASGAFEQIRIKTAAPPVFKIH
ncbi:MAG: phage terminase large subunit [Candidatus Bathyarchaeota archaeon]|nr:phage terminase large subunit [Candidatus Termiticorpusculum sp.]